MVQPSPASRPSGDLAAPDRLSPSRRLIWDTLEASMRERWEHHSLPELHPAEVREAMFAPTTPMVGARETLARLMGPPVEQPGVGMSSTVDPGKILIRQRSVEPTLSERTSHGDGTWSLRRQDGAAIGELRWMGPVLYEFQGQTRHSSRPRSGGWRWKEAERGRDDISNRGQILGSIRTDANGGKWKAVDIDEQGVAALVAAYDLAMSMATGEEEPGATEQFEDYEDEGGWSLPMGRWTEKTCDSGNVCQLLDGEDNRTRLERIPTERQKATAMLARDQKGEGLARDFFPSCSGVFLTPWTILTAAHCVRDDAADDVLDHNLIRVCTQGNRNLAAKCSNISGTIDVPNKYTPGPRDKDSSHDYALIHVTSTDESFADSHSHMYMTKAKDSWIEKHSMYNVAAPYSAPPLDGSGDSCSSNIGGAVIGLGDYSPRLVDNGANLVLGRGEVKAKYRTFKHFFSFCQGHSGSAIYFCQGGRCDTGESGKIASIAANYRKGQGFRGPKVRRFRSWALTRMIIEGW